MADNEIKDCFESAIKDEEKVTHTKENKSKDKDDSEEDQ